MTELPPDARAVAKAGHSDAAVRAPASADPALDAASAAGVIPGPGGSGEDAGVLAERERLARQLRETRMQLAMTQQRLTALQNSATMALGKTLVNAAKRPWPRGAQLPRDLYRMWRDRGAPGKSGGATLATALAAAQLADLKGTGGRFLSALTAPGALSLADPALLGAGDGLGSESPRLVITGALTSLACATLAPDAVVHPLLPHDADVLIEGTGADLVVIEAAALLPGSPWAHATDPAAADRGRRLARMIVMARSLGKPVALVRNVPPALLPALGWVAEACDVVWDGGLGVQLARFNPVGISPARPTDPLYAGDRDPREAPAARTLLDQLTARSANTPGANTPGANTPGADAAAAVTVTGGRSWRTLPELYRGNAVFVTASPQQAREQAACGARVIGPIGSGADAAAVAAEVSAAGAAAPLTHAEIQAGLREVFQEHATPVTLAGLVARAGLPATLVGGRQLTVLATVDGGSAAGSTAASAQAAALGTALLGQQLRPAEVIVGAPAAYAGPVREALKALRDAGIRVRVTDAADAGSLASLANSPWLAPWPAEPVPGSYLADLACGRECAQADAVALVDGAAGYDLTRQLAKPALVRRELFLPGAPAPEAWGARGLRLLTITSETGAQ
jgi:hypothetical protein